MDRSYGTSGYKPSPREGSSEKHPEKPKVKKTRTPKAKLTKLLHALLILLGVGLFAVWLSLGEFRFMLWRAPSFTGFPFGNRTYLVLFQNNYELRPTGGFISTYGELTFSHGVYTGMEFHDVYAEVDDHEFVEPPLVLSTLLANEDYAGHTFRDANFDPDFRLSKDSLIEMYQLTNESAEIDGVIAMDFTFLESLVGLYEPMTVEGYELTEQNLFETLSSISSDVDRHSLTELESRKNITTPLVKKIITKTLVLPWRIFSVMDLLAEGFREKHVLASFNRNGLASSFRERNWDGALPQSDMGDFLAINEGNYGGMKSDRYFTRDVVYELTVTDQKDVLGNPIVKATVSVTLSHEGGNNVPLSGNYTGYLRTLIPLGSNITAGSTITEDRDDVYVLGEIVRLAPGESVTYSYSYELPEYVWYEDVYYLHLHKQPGTEADHYRVIVKVPEGMSLSAPLFDVRENVAFLDTPLLTDLNLSFTLLEDTTPPRLIYNELTALNEVTIQFNETLAGASITDPLNYQITDLNQENEDITDTVTVRSVRMDGNQLVLTTEGMTDQPEEFYEVVFRGVSDSKGNTQDPNPRTVTVVQRNLEEAVESEETEVLPVEE